MSPLPGYSELLSPHRLAALDETDLLDEDAGEVFTRLTDLAASSLRAPIAMVNLIDAHRQVTIRQTGAPRAVRETRLDHSVCRHLVESGEPLVIADVRADPRTAANPVVHDLGIVSYLGVPLNTSRGLVLGSLCAIDTTPRRWSSREVEVLSSLSRVVIREVEALAAYRLERERRVSLEGAAIEANRRLASVNEALSASEERLIHWRVDTIGRLARATELRSEETGAHIQGVARLAEMIARRLGTPAPEARRIGLASGLHDVGKIAIPDAILHKSGALSAEERAVMQTHARIGHDMLSGSGDSLLELAAQIALAHHERFDGQGYPRGLSGSDIPIAARIVAVADVFDALTSIRSYRAALPIHTALSMIRMERGKHFDPRVLDALLAELGEAPEEPSGVVDPGRATAPVRRARASRTGRRHSPEVYATARAVAARLTIPAAIADRVIAETAEGARVSPSLAEHIAHSPEASVRVLDAASELTGLRPISSIQEVMVAMGPARVRRAFEVAQTYSIFDPSPGRLGMSGLAFAMRCSQVASVAVDVARYLHGGRDDQAGDAWLAGLLHDIGAAVMLAEHDAPDVMGRLSALDKVPPSDHPILGAWLGEHWGLSTAAVRAIRCHEDPRPPRQTSVAQAVWLSVRIVETRMGLQSSDALVAAASECGVDQARLAQLTMGERVASQEEGVELLTRRQAEVLRLLADGLVAKQISQQLGCTMSTVHNHLHRIYGKLGVVNQAQALLAARERGWI